jgi:putative transposase
MLSVLADEAARTELHADLDGLAREGARRMLAAALEAEVDEDLAAYAAERDERGRSAPRGASRHVALCLPCYSR